MNGLVELLEGVLFVAIVSFVLTWLLRRQVPRKLLPILTVAAAVLLLVGVQLLRTGAPSELARAQPTFERSLGYASSSTCRSCHPAEHASWHKSYHRTMTQTAHPERVLAPFAGESLDVGIGTLTFLRKEGAPWAIWKPKKGKVLADPVVMMTGSHHFQLYWVREKSGIYQQVPAVWVIAERRWVPNPDSFLRPPEKIAGATWNDSCIECHTTNARPNLRYKPDTAASSVVEFGIACESCHGPGDRHVRTNRDPLRRYGQHFRDKPDDTIINPARLDHRAGSQVCGSCHSIAEMKYRDLWLVKGGLFQPGQPFDEYYRVVRYEEKPQSGWLKEREEDDPLAYHGGFWRDGTARVAGREYNGLVESPCFQRGKMSCFSCHSLHGYQSTNDQLAPRMRGDRACLQCHQSIALRPLEAHTHHRAESPGSRCYNCHMPYTSFGVLTAVRSHRVTSPSAMTTLRHGRPNACNLCHLDQPLSWTASWLSKWYGSDPSLLEFPPDERSIAQGVLLALRGDAVQRVVTAWSMGWAPARLASGEGWLPAVLAVLLEDDYSAVRFVAGRSLRQVKGFADVSFDYTAPSRQRAGVVRKVISRWRDGRPADLSRRRPHLLLEATGEWNELEKARLLKGRDRRPVSVHE